MLVNCCSASIHLPDLHKHVVRTFSTQTRHVWLPPINVPSPNRCSWMACSGCLDFATNIMECCLEFVQMIFDRSNTRRVARFRRNLHNHPAVLENENYVKHTNLLSHWPKMLIRICKIQYFLHFGRFHDGKSVSQL